MAGGHHAGQDEAAEAHDADEVDLDQSADLLLVDVVQLLVAIERRGRDDEQLRARPARGVRRATAVSVAAASVDRAEER